jgi:DNA repair exonuclease SbcCD nuclease subunit
VKTVVVGDVHAVPQELLDCEALWRLVMETVKKYDVDQVLLLGDQFNTHDIVNTRVIDFWMNSIKTMGVGGPEVIALVGNHDQLTPTIRHPHAMVPYQDVCVVVDRPMRILNSCYMPYYANPVEFVESAVKLHCNNSDVDTLFCHQTFSGADQALGFYSKDAVEPSAVPFKRILSGHIHKPMRFGKVWYVGASRWRTLTDAETETRNIYVLESGKAPIAIPTNTHCIRIYKFEDSEDAPAQIDLTPEQLKLADLRITINGTSDYIAKRMTELKAQYNAKCRGVPVRGRLAKASESEGIDNAFQRFAKAFSAPNGTSQEQLIKEVHARF